MADNNEAKMGEKAVEAVEEHAADVDETLEDDDLEAQLAYEDFKRAREKRKRRRTIIIAAIIAVALIVVIAIAIGNSGGGEGEGEMEPLDVTSPVAYGDFATTVNASGATQPAASTVVTPEVEGIIENLQVAEGDTVKKGDLLFTVKNDELDKQVRTAQVALDSAERQVGTASAAVNEAVAAYQSAWDECNESGDWSTFDEAALNGAVSSAEDGYADAVSARDEAALSLQEAQANADKRTVTSPVSGEIVSMSAVEGASTNATNAEGGTGSPLMQIADLSSMKVTVEVNEADIISITEGQAAKVTFTALPEVELDATVERIATTSSSSGGDGGYGGGGGVVTYAVTLVIPKPDSELKPGMTANVTITTQSVKDTLIVPVSAIMEDGEGGGTVTVLVDEETGEKRDVTVKIIEKNSSEAAVESDELEDGDLVVLGGGGSIDLEGEELMGEALETL